MLQTFTDTIMTSVSAVLPFIAGGVAAGAVVWLVFLGMRLGIQAFRQMQDDRAYRADPDGWWDRYRDSQ